MTIRTSRIPGENSQLLQAIHDRLNDAAWIDKASSPMVEFKSLWLHDVREISGNWNSDYCSTDLKMYWAAYPRVGWKKEE